MLSDPFLPRRRSLSTPHGIGTVARLGVMPRWLLADADRWRFGSAGRSYRPLRTPPISEHSHRVLAIVLHAANALAIPAPRPPHGVVPGLRGDNLPLDAGQHQLRFGQGQTQIGDVDEAIGPANLHDVCVRPLAFRPDFHQPQNPSHVSTLGQRTSAEIPDRRRTPNLATVPRAAAGVPGLRGRLPREGLSPARD